MLALSSLDLRLYFVQHLEAVLPSARLYNVIVLLATMAFLTVAFFGDWSDLRSWRSGLGGLVDAAYPSPVHLTTMNLVGSRTGQWGARAALCTVLSPICT